MVTAELLASSAWRVALSLPGVDESQPFGPQFEVFKVVGKVFMMTTLVRGEPIVTLKCEPETSQALRQAHSSIRAGYHMNKKHWISISHGPGVSQALIEELVQNAYLLVVDGLTRAQKSALGSLPPGDLGGGDLKHA